jgi:hypothetical protein
MSEKRPNPAFDKEKAEGSRETVDRALEAQSNEEGAEREDQVDEGGAKPQGITNRPLEEEQRQQEQVPPRGTRKGNVSA